MTISVALSDVMPYSHLMNKREIAELAAKVETARAAIKTAYATLAATAPGTTENDVAYRAWGVAKEDVDDAVKAHLAAVSAGQPVKPFRGVDCNTGRIHLGGRGR
jgi:hypothetical protein